MAAYDIRVQIAVPDGLKGFTYNGFRRALAKFAQRRGAVTVWVDGEKWDSEYNSFDGEWAADEGEIRGNYGD